MTNPDYDEDILDEMKDSRLISRLFKFGSYQSFEFRAKNLLWKFQYELATHKVHPNRFIIQCDTGTKGTYWSIDASFQMRIEIHETCEEIWNRDIVEKLYFSRKMICGVGSLKKYPDSPTQLLMEIKINVLRVHDLYRFPDHYLEQLLQDSQSNVILKVEQTKIRVNKEFLSMHSPVFNAMFKPYFVENEQEEIEIKEVETNIFMEFLRVIYYRKTICDRAMTMMGILEIADRFQVQSVINYCEKKICDKTPINMANHMELLETADKYKLNLLQECISRWIKSKEHKPILRTEKFSKLSKETQLAIRQALA